LAALCGVVLLVGCGSVADERGLSLQDPQNAAAFYQLATVYDATGRTALAREMYATLVAAKDGDADSRWSGDEDMVSALYERAEVRLAEIAPAAGAAASPASGPVVDGAPSRDLAKEIAAINQRLAEMTDRLDQILIRLDRLSGHETTAALEAPALEAPGLEVPPAADLSNLSEAPEDVAMAESLPTVGLEEDLAAILPAAGATAEASFVAADDGLEKAMFVSAPEGDANEPATPDDGVWPDAAYEIALGSDPSDDGAAVGPADSMGIKLHLASYRHWHQAVQGWSILQSENFDLLGSLTLDIKEIDLGPGMGIFYRVRGGPVATESEAKSLCKEFESRNLYCASAYF
jgi:hypothetical protein